MPGCRSSHGRVWSILPTYIHMYVAVSIGPSLQPDVAADTAREISHL